MARKKKIRIETEGAEMVPIGEIIGFQGDLKTIDEQTLITFALQIEVNGFSEPISVWRQDRAHNWIVDGHQRLLAVKYMAEKMGYELPERLPVSFVTAENKDTAKDMVLGNISQFGEIDEEGMAEFLHGTDIEFEELGKQYRFSGFNLPKFIEGYKPSLPGSTNQELDFPEDTEVKRAHVKTVQLFYDRPTARELSEMIEVLKKRFELESATSAILFSVERVITTK